MQHRFGLRLAKQLVIAFRNCIIWILDMYCSSFSLFHILYMFQKFLFYCVVIDDFAASIYAETREEARDYARLRNMCFDQVRT